MNEEIIQQKTITAEERERLRTDEALREALGKYIGSAPNTIYDQAKYRPHLLNAPAVLDFIRKYIDQYPEPIIEAE